MIYRGRSHELSIQEALNQRKRAMLSGLPVWLFECTRKVKLSLDALDLAKDAVLQVLSRI
jgi:hypothetical protein